jgi:hypothetical protein
VSERRHSHARAVSPELVLVDENLADWARLRLREDAVAAESVVENGRPLAESARFPKSAHFTNEALRPLHKEVDLDVTSTPSRRSAKQRFKLAVYGAVLVALLAALVVYVRASTGSKQGSAATSDSSTRVFAWPAVPRARYYAFRLYRGSMPIFRAKVVARQRLALPHTWVYEGNHYVLSPGTYRWVVLAFVGPPSRMVTKTVVAAALAVNPRH